MNNYKKTDEIELGGIFYPTKDIQGNVIPFDSLYLPYIWKEIYLEGCYIDMMNTRKDLIIIDVGSQIGLTVKYFREYAKIIYAIEPSTESFTALAKNVEFNKWTNVVPIKAAIADKDGEMTLNLNTGNRTCHSLTQTYGQGGEKVKTICFETLFKEQKIDKVDFMKFDVEGAEEMILMGESFTKMAPKIDALEVEFHYPTFPKIVEHLMKLGYKARRYDASAVIILFTRS